MRKRYELRLCFQLMVVSENIEEKKRDDREVNIHTYVQQIASKKKTNLEFQTDLDIYN